MDQILHSNINHEVAPGEQAPISDAIQTPVSPDIDGTPEINAKVGFTSRINDTWGGAKEAWSSGNIKTFMTLESMRDEFWSGFNEADSIKDKVGIVYTTGVAVGGQAYERFRLPESYAAAVGTGGFKETVERGHSTAIATLAGSVLVGAFVYLQQKVIGRNMIRTAKYFPETYDTAKDLWPKQLDVVDNTLPGKDEPVKQGIAMVGVGTTPFVMTARANNPEITDKELRNVERTVTRRGSIASAGAGAIVLGSLSIAPHIPEKVSFLDPIESIRKRTLSFETLKVPASVSEQLVDKSQLIVDTLSSPIKMIALLVGIPLVAKAAGKLLRKPEPKE